jgi:hypothetical protein
MRTTERIAAAVVVRERGDAPSIVITALSTDVMGDTIDPLGMDVTAYLGGTRAVNFAHDHRLKRRARTGRPGASASSGASTPTRSRRSGASTSCKRRASALRASPSC